MITDLLIAALAWIAGKLLDLLPDIEPPAWIGDVAGYAGSVFAFADSIGVWFPWGVLSTVLASVFACAAIGFGIKAVRMVISLMTAGGGSAA